MITRHYHGDDSDVKVLMGGILQAFATMSVDTYAELAERFLLAARHPTLGRRLRDCIYFLMVELLRYLEANGFIIYIASGGDRDFFRPVTEEIYGILAERVIGTSAVFWYIDDDSGGSVVYQAEMDVFDDGLMKLVRIWSRIGWWLVVVGGNFNGDILMFWFVGCFVRLGLWLLILYDDEECEFSYIVGVEVLFE